MAERKIERNEMVFTGAAEIIYAVAEELSQVHFELYYELDPTVPIERIKAERVLGHLRTIDEFVSLVKHLIDPRKEGSAKE